MSPAAKRTRSSPSSPARRRPAAGKATGPIPLPGDRKALRLGYYFDKQAADRVCAFIENFCRHSSGRFAGQPFLLARWQRDFLRNLYGWKRPDGTRRFRETYVEIPKKNGKSTTLAAIALYGLAEEPGAEVYPGAVDREQAGIIFNECARMVRASPALSEIFEVIDSRKRIVFRARNAFLQAMSADVPSKDGINASMTILDELHRFASPAMYDVMKYAGAARSEPILAIITTAGHDRHSICYELHTRARAILDGTVEDLEFLPLIYAADEADDPDDPATWRKANPALGSVLKVEDFRKAHAEAKLLPRLWALFLRLRLCIWTEQVTRWLRLDLWDAGKSDDPFPFAGKTCYAALDISSVADLTSLHLLFVEGDDVRAIPYFFVPEDTAARRAEVDKVPYPDWIADGHAIGTPGNSTDHRAIRKLLNDLVEQGLTIAKVGIDPWNAAQLANDLVEDGFDVEFMRQGYATLTAPSKELERRLLAGTIRHDGNPVQRWCVANVATETDSAGNIKPSKKKSAERIDGVVSLVMALGLMMAYPDTGPPSITILSPPSGR